MANEDTNKLMNRIEDKFLVKRNRLPELLDILRYHLPETDPDTEVRYNVNRSFYMDNPDLDSLKDGISGSKPRMKLRVRQYAPNADDWEDTAYVELKIKEEDGNSVKSRVRIPEHETDNVLCGNFITVTPELLKLNLDIPKEELFQHIVKMNEIISKYGYKHQTTVLYYRRAYSNKDIRITIDEDINYYDAQPVTESAAKGVQELEEWEKKVKGVDRVKGGDYLVVEVKHEEGNIPEWVEDVLKLVDAEDAKFSKYCAAMVVFLTQGRKKTNSISTSDASIDAKVKALETIKGTE